MTYVRRSPPSKSITRCAARTLSFGEADWPTCPLSRAWRWNSLHMAGRWHGMMTRRATRPLGAGKVLLSDLALVMKYTRCRHIGGDEFGFYRDPLLAVSHARASIPPAAETI